ncbi:MAG TPA: chorismate mutase [Acidimicrobiales bacterium]|nr:chorismate mutase [Acidimicrobiales bacterium]
MTLRAIRGATTVEEDESSQIIGATKELLEEILRRNEIRRDDLVCIFFSSTPDLTSAFPATGAHALDLDDVPLFGAVELGVRGALERCIRIMVQCYSENSRAEIHHVYTKGAVVLRTDLVE